MAACPPPAFLRNKSECRSSSEKLWPTSRHQKKCAFPPFLQLPQTAQMQSVEGTHSGLRPGGQPATALWKLLSERALAGRALSGRMMSCRWRAGQGCSAHSDDGQRWRSIRAPGVAAWLHHCRGTCYLAAFLLCVASLHDDEELIQQPAKTESPSTICRERDTAGSECCVFGHVQVRMSPDNMTAFILWDAHDDRLSAAEREVGYRSEMASACLGLGTCENASNSSYTA